MESQGSHWTLSGVFACAIIHIGMAAFGLDGVLHATGEGLGEAIGTIEPHA